MRWVYLVQVSLTLLPTVAYAILFGRPWRHNDRAFAWMVASWVWTAALLEVRLLFVLAGIPLPGWSTAAILTGPLAVSWWRLWVFLQARSRR